MRPLHRFAWASVACLLLLPGCGSESAGVPADRPALLQRLDLEPRGTVPEPALLARWDFSEDRENWRMEAPVVNLLPRPGSKSEADRRLILRGTRGDGIIDLRRSGDFDVLRANRLRLVAGFQGAGRIIAELSRGGERLLVSEPMHLGSSETPYATELILRPAEGAPDAERADTLRLHVGGGNRVFEPVFVELEFAPLSSLMPDPAGPPEMIVVANGCRSGEGLVTGRPLTQRVQEVPEGAELSWSIGRTQALATGSARARLVVSAREDGEEPRELWSGPVEVVDDWTEHRVPLAEFAGREVEFSFTLEAPGGRDAGCIVAEAALVVPGAAPPPVLLVTTDTHRGDHLGAAGQGVEITTPALDALAARGVFFENCWSAINSTNPSHISMMTGTHPRDTGIVVNRRPLGEVGVTLAETFRDAGWATYAVISTNHLGHTGSGLGQGFDRMIWPPLQPARAEVSVERMLEWLPDAEGRPLFVWLHVFDAHTPYEPPKEWLRKEYPADRDPFAPSAASDPSEVPQDALPPELKGLMDIEYPRAAYRGEVRYLDSQLARAFDHERLRDGVIAVVGDHGESLGETDVYFHHAGLSPGTLHVPLILTWPGAPAGTRVAAPVSSPDLARTLLDLAGLEETDFPGDSLLRTLNREHRSGPRFQLGSSSQEASVQYGPHLLVLSLKEHHVMSSIRARAHHQVELFNVDADPGCQVDLVEREPELAAQLRGRLIEWLDRAPAEGLAGGATDDPELLAQLVQLGYVDHEADAGTASLFERDDCDWCARFE